MDESKTVGEEEFKESRIASVDDSEPVFTTSYCQLRPSFSIHDYGVSEILRLPLWMNRRVVPSGVHVNRTVCTEASVEDNQRTVELVTSGESEVGLDVRVTNDIGPDEAC